jgi:hypothetical protein
LPLAETKKQLTRNILPHPHPIPTNITPCIKWDKKVACPIPTQTPKQPNQKTNHPHNQTVGWEKKTPTQKSPHKEQGSLRQQLLKKTNQSQVSAYMYLLLYNVSHIF